MMSVRPAVLIAALLAPGPLAASEPLPAFTLEDVDERPLTFHDGVRRIYATADRDSGDVIAHAMKELGQKELDAQDAIAIAEFEAAPFFIKPIIRGTFEDLPYVMWLDDQGVTQALWPRREGHVTVIDLDRRRITQVRHFKDPAALRAVLLDAGTAADAPATSDATTPAGE